MSNRERQDRISTEDLEVLVSEILSGLTQPYPEDITDQVFLSIEHNPEFLRQYRLLAGQKTNAANRIIGKLVKKLTGLEVKGKCRNPQSTLIKTHKLLG